jgi:hypothetical protein
MKAKKALRRLTKVETLLSKIIEQLPRRKDSLGELLISAREAVDRAKQTVNSQVSTTTAKKPPKKATTSFPGRLTEEGRKSISRAAKKRWAIAKRKGMNAVTGQPLSKTA